MTMETQTVELRKIIADEGKVFLITPETQDENGNVTPAETSKEIYLGVNDSAENYPEIDEVIQ